MIYKAKKRDNFYYSTEQKSYIYKGLKVSAQEAQKLKHKWAKADLIENAAKDEDISSLKLEMFNALVKNVSARELTAKSQALTYHNIKRYVNHVFDHYSVVLKEIPLSKLKRPHAIPVIKATQSPWFQVGEEDGVFTYKGKSYNDPEIIKKIMRDVIFSELALYATNDDSLSNLANSTGAALLSEFTNIAEQNNEMKKPTPELYEYLKHLIVTVDRFFDLELKGDLTIKVEMRAITGIARYRIG